MSETVDCPHQRPLGRICPGCQRTQQPAPDRGPHLFSCDGEITGRVYSDSDGDDGVINGVRRFTAIEDARASCGCDLSVDEWHSVHEAMFKSYIEDDGLADM